MSLTKDQIIAAQDARVTLVDVPEWGGEVCLRTLSGAERDAFEASVSGDGQRHNLVNIRARFAALVIADKQGNRLFDDSDTAMLGKRNAKALDRIFESGRQHNGMTDEEVEELEKNSGGGQSEGST